MPLPPNAQGWLDLAGMDYIGPFVKTVLPLLDAGNITADSQSLKQSVADLHRKLDDLHFEVRKNGINERISFRTVCLRPQAFNGDNTIVSQHEYAAVKVQNGGGRIQVTVTSQTTGVVRFDEEQDHYSPAEILMRPAFEGLSLAQQNRLRTFYEGCNPRPMINLVQNGEPPIDANGVEFRCTPDDLFSGIIETIYSMRNALLHGEVEPDPGLLDCYEPAYRIILQFLERIR